MFGELTWDRDLGAARGTRLGPAAGLERLGCTLYELDPGGQAAPYHSHHGNEELLVVLEGTLELRTPEGTREIGAGAVVGFPTGPGGAHRLRNRSPERARYVIVSTMRFPEVAEQLDTGTILAMKGPGDGWAFPAGSDGDYMALTIEALHAEDEDAASLIGVIAATASAGSVSAMCPPTAVSPIPAAPASGRSIDTWTARWPPRRTCTARVDSLSRISIRPPAAVPTALPSSCVPSGTRWMLAPTGSHWFRSAIAPSSGRLRTAPPRSENGS